MMKFLRCFAAIAFLTFLATPVLVAQEKVIGEERGVRPHSPDEHIATGDGHEYPIVEPSRWGTTEQWELGLGLTFLAAVLILGTVMRNARSRPRP